MSFDNFKPKKKTVSNFPNLPKEVKVTVIKPYIKVKKNDIKIIVMALKTYHQAYKNKAIKGAGSQIIIDRVEELMEELK